MNDYKLKILSYLPLYERKSNVFNEIVSSQIEELNGLERKIKSIENDIFIDTAIESLSIFERDLNINSTSSLSNNQRREQISSRNRAVFDQTTEDTIKNVASAFSNGIVEVNQTEVSGIFEIKFVGVRGVPDNIEGLKEALDVIIPAHLGLTYTFTYNAWSFVKGMTWSEGNVYTWEGLRSEVI